MASGLNPETTPIPRRERIRARTLVEIKDAARRQIAAGGAGTLSLKALAHELGMAGPSLYRYVAGRDELLTEILVESYTELGQALETAAAGAPPGPAERLRHCARAYRRWALARPGVYELLFGAPVPGYAAPVAATQPPARRALAVLVAVATELGPADGNPVVVATQIWARLHGLLSLELRGHLAPLVESPAALYDAEIELAITVARTG